MAIQKTENTKDYVNLSFSYQENGQEKKVELEHVRSYKYFGWILKVLGKASSITLQEEGGETIYVNTNSLAKSLFSRVINDLNHSENIQQFENNESEKLKNILPDLTNKKSIKKSVKSLKRLLGKDIKEIKGDVRHGNDVSNSISDIYISTMGYLPQSTHYKNNFNSLNTKESGSEYLYYYYRNTQGITDEQREAVFEKLCQLEFDSFKKKGNGIEYKREEGTHDLVQKMRAGRGYAVVTFVDRKLNSIKDSEKMVRCREKLGLPPKQFNV